MTINNRIKKPMAAILCCTILVGGIGATAFALASEKDKEKEEKKESVLISADSDAELVKDEAVYVLAGADGSVEKIIVSDWIKNSIGSPSFSDKSDLTNVENVKGDESYTMSGDNMRVWDARGNDIYYQGNIEKELPVSLSITYKLDGKAVTSEELAGKSGKVTIRFDYINHQYEYVSIDGKKEKIYVPFVMLTGILLDNDIFANIEVSNGKLINDGNHTAVAGISFPGLQNNLNLDKEKLEIPEYVEINADVKNFKMENTVTIATNSIFNHFNTESLNSIDELTNSLDELTDAMDQLTDGSSELYNGLSTLLNKSEELISGINKMADGAAKLKSGAGAVDSGAGDLSNGLGQLAEGLGQLADNSNALNTGSKQIFESLLNMANTQLASAGISVPKLTVENYANTLNNVIASLDESNVAAQARSTALEAVTTAVNAQKDDIRTRVSAAIQEEVNVKVAETVRQNVETQVLASINMTKEQYDAAVRAGMIPSDQQAQITQAIDVQMQGEAAQTMIADNVKKQMESYDIQTLISSKTDEQIAILIEQNMNSADVQAQITAALEKAKSGAASISALKEQLDGYNAFYVGLNQYTAGVSSAKTGADALTEGAEKLKTGTSELHTGMNELYNGILTLKNGAPALIDGVTQLRDGSMKLSDGLNEFNEKGVQKLTDAVNENIGDLITRIKATIDVSKCYKSFSGLSDSMDGQVKFIYRTESIE